MNRKDFISRIIKLGVIPAFLLTRIKTGAAQNEETAESSATQQKFTGQWLVSLLNNMNNKLPEQDKVKLLESCGRDCARNGAVQMAQANKGNVQGLIDKLGEILGKENAVLAGNKATIKYSKCYCANLANFTGTMPGVYCNCSRGWVLELFETAAQKPVKVELVSSIVRGADHCEFSIEI